MTNKKYKDYLNILIESISVISALGVIFSCVIYSIMFRKYEIDYIKLASLSDIGRDGIIFSVDVLQNTILILIYLIATLYCLLRINNKKIIFNDKYIFYILLICLFFSMAGSLINQNYIVDNFVSRFGFEIYYYLKEDFDSYITIILSVLLIGYEFLLNKLNIKVNINKIKKYLSENVHWLTPSTIIAAILLATGSILIKLSMHGGYIGYRGIVLNKEIEKLCYDAVQRRSENNLKMNDRDGYRRVVVNIVWTGSNSILLRCYYNNSLDFMDSYDKSFMHVNYIGITGPQDIVHLWENY